MAAAQAAVGRYRNMNISHHAAKRYCERMGCNGYAAARKSIRELMKEAHELELKPQWKTRQLMKHGAHARYFRYVSSFRSFVFVVVSGVVVSMHSGEAKKWKRKHSET